MWSIFSTYAVHSWVEWNESVFVRASHKALRIFNLSDIEDLNAAVAFAAVQLGPLAVCWLLSCCCRLGCGRPLTMEKELFTHMAVIGAVLASVVFIVTTLFPILVAIFPGSTK